MYSELERQLLEVQENYPDVAQYIQGLKTDNQKWKEVAIRDAVTGLYSRHFFNEELPRILSESERRRTPLSLLMLDLDRLKLYNDAHGHLAGDGLLKKAGEVICSNIRRMDITCRYGGDEFVVILPHTRKKSPTKIARKIATRISGSFQNQMPLTVSIGIVSSYGHSSADELIYYADQALYCAKRRSCCIHQYHKILP